MLSHNDIIYLDNAATTKIDEQVFDTMLPYLQDNYGNPSAAYDFAIQNHTAIEHARQQIATYLNCKPTEVYFTSGGSESDNFIIKGIAYAAKYIHNITTPHIITSKTEHSAVLNTCKQLQQEGFSITYLNVDTSGQIDLTQLKNSITPSTCLISIMTVNNETGVIQPISEIAALSSTYNIPFHTDAVQAIGHIILPTNIHNITALSLSGHKLYAPKGIGAFYLNENTPILPLPLINGGHQEFNLRAGTENVPSIVALGKAIELLPTYDNLSLSKLRDYYESQILKYIPQAIIHSSSVPRAPHISSISFPVAMGDSIQFRLNIENICVSTGSACNSKDILPSHVLTAMNIPQSVALNTIRVSLGKYNTLSDIDTLLITLIPFVQNLVKLQS